MVELIVDEMDRTATDLRTKRNRRLVNLGAVHSLAAERRNEARVNVKDAIFEVGFE